MTVKVITGDCVEVLNGLPSCFRVNTCVTSPPYWGLRDYGVEGQIGLETSPDAYVARLVEVFRAVREKLADDGTLWLNLGDSYAGGGRGGNPEDSPFRKQATNRGSLVAPSPLGPGLKPKDLVGIPWRVAFALQADGWYLRSDIIWSKPNPMPESVTDRPTKAHEYIFLLSKRERYYYDAKAIAEAASYAMYIEAGQDYNGQATKDYGAAGMQNPSDLKRRIIAGKIKQASGTYSDDSGRNDGGLHTSGGFRSKSVEETGILTRNRRSVWTVTTKPYSGAHFATFPPDLIEPCILAGCPEGGTVLDPFGGAGTTGLVTDRLQRNAMLIELNPSYADMARERIRNDAGMFAEVA